MSKNKFLSLSVLLLASSLAYAHKTIYLISPPRSSSVSFLRMMEARKDFAILHEPCVHPHAILLYPTLTQEWFEKATFQTFIDVKKEILKIAEKSNVFIKDMSWAAKKLFDENGELVSADQTYFIFLIRNPHHSIISFYKKCPLYQESFSYLIGYKALYELYLLVQEKAAQKPLIILAEDLYTNPQATIKAFCNHVAIDFKPESLHWQSLGNDFTGQEWQEEKYPKYTHHWHGEAITSSGFSKPTTNYKEDANEQPTFEEILDPEHRIMCIRAYEENIGYYKQLLKYKD